MNSASQTIPGVVLHVQVSRTQGITRTTDGRAYIRRGAQNLPQETPEQIKRLEYTKGLASFEGHPVNASKELVVESAVMRDYLKYVNSKLSSPAGSKWLRKHC